MQDLTSEDWQSDASLQVIITKTQDKRYQYQYQYQATLEVAETILWFVPVAVDTVKNCTPDDGCIKHPKHVE